jgi:hypothetical protein
MRVNLIASIAIAILFGTPWSASASSATQVFRNTWDEAVWDEMSDSFRQHHSQSVNPPEYKLQSVAIDMSVYVSGIEEGDELFYNIVLTPNSARSDLVPEVDGKGAAFEFSTVVDDPEALEEWMSNDELAYYFESSTLLGPHAVLVETTITYTYTPMSVRVFVVSGNSVDEDGGIAELDIREHVTVAISPDDESDVMEIDPSSISFGPANAMPDGDPVIKDADGDGQADLVVTFKLKNSGTGCGLTEIPVHCRTLSGIDVDGHATLSVSGCGGIR